MTAASEAQMQEAYFAEINRLMGREPLEPRDEAVVTQAMDALVQALRGDMQSFVMFYRHQDGHVCRTGSARAAEEIDRSLAGQAGSILLREANADAGGPIRLVLT